MFVLYPGTLFQGRAVVLVPPFFLNLIVKVSDRCSFLKDFLYVASLFLSFVCYLVVFPECLVIKHNAMSVMQSESSSSTKLNPVQLHLLELFSKDMTEQELLDIKALLVQYYSRKVDEELDLIWEKRNYSEESFKEATQNLHLH